MKSLYDEIVERSRREYLFLAGQSARAAIPARKDKTLLDTLGLKPESTADAYCLAIQNVMRDRFDPQRITWEEFLGFRC